LFKFEPTIRVQKVHRNSGIICISYLEYRFIKAENFQEYFLCSFNTKYQIENSLIFGETKTVETWGSKWEPHP
jgi:hypothetical protein